MKILRYRMGSEVKPGIIDADENIRDASGLVSDWDAENITVEKLNELKNIDTSSLDIIQNHDGIAPCVCKKSVGKIICIGLNYSDHAEETGMEVPPEPIIFFKATSAIVDVIFPIPASDTVSKLIFSIFVFPINIFSVIIFATATAFGIVFPLAFKLILF